MEVIHSNKIAVIPNEEVISSSLSMLITVMPINVIKWLNLSYLDILGIRRHLGAELPLSPEISLEDLGIFEQRLSRIVHPIKFLLK